MFATVNCLGRKLSYLILPLISVSSVHKISYSSLSSSALLAIDRRLAYGLCIRLQLQ